MARIKARMYGSSALIVDTDDPKELWRAVVDADGEEVVVWEEKEGEQE